MDQASVEAAYQSTDIPLSAATVTWDPQGTTMTINPNADLQIATGGNPATVTALSYSYTITTAAKDLAGNPLTLGYTVQFSTYRHIIQTLVPEYSAYVRSDNGPAGYTAGATAFWVGDNNLNYGRREIISFDMSAIPRNIPGSGWNSVELMLFTGAAAEGTPYASLGPDLNCDILSDPNTYTYNGAHDWRTTIPEAGATKTINVRSGIVFYVYLNNEPRAQFRLGFPTGTNSDSAPDRVFYDNRAVLIFDYNIP